MLRYLLSLVFFFHTFIIIGQKESPYIGSNLDTEVEWIRLMYTHADVGQVMKSYKEYYSTHEFVKNEHTQFYKRWLKSITRGVSHDKRNNRPERTGANRVQDWTSIGPFDWDHHAAGRSYAPGSAHIYTVEQSISSPNTLYAGAAESGVWKSTDRGSNWIPLTYTYDVNTVYALEIAFNNPNIVYIALLQSIYKTTNGGTTWLPTGDAAFQALDIEVRDIKMDPTNSNIVLAATSNGLYRTINAGGTWTQIVSGDFQEIEFHPTNVNTIYASRVNGELTNFFRSLNNGVSFTQIGNGWPLPVVANGEHQKRVELATSLDNPNAVYVHATGKANGGEGLYGFYKSLDQGVNWTFTCCGSGPGGPPSVPDNINIMGWADNGSDDGGQYYYDVAFAVSPTNSDSMFASGVNLWVSGNEGTSWTCPAAWSHPHKPNYVHADIHDINYYAHTHEIWVACDGGIFYSNDNGANFTRKVNGISGTDFWGYGQGWWEGDIMLGGAYHNGTLLKENNVYINGWLCTDGGDGTFGFVNPGRSKNVHGWFDIKDLKSNRTIAPVTRGNPYEPNGSYIVGDKSDILFHPNYYDTWWVGSGNIMYKTEDNGFTFTTLHNFGAKIGSMDHCFSNPNVIYAATFPGWWDNKKVYRSDNGGVSFVEITPPTALLVNELYVPFDVAVDPMNAQNVYLIRTPLYQNTNLNGRIVFFSSNGGVSWSNITSTLPSVDPTNICYQFGTNNGIYVGTKKGVWHRNANVNWTNITSDLPVSTYSEKIVPYYRKGKIRNATNRSVWERNMVEASQPVAMPSVQKKTLYCTQDTAYFVDHSVVSENGGSWFWEFQGGSPATSTERNPRVVYECPGDFSVTLTVTDVNGSSSKTVAKIVSVLEDCKSLIDPAKALSIVPNNQFVSVSDVNWTTNNFTITAWIKPNGTQAEYSGIFMADGTAAGLNFKTNNHLGYHWPGGQWWWDSNLTAPSGQWSHVALVVTPTTVKIYLNGIAASQNIALSAATINAFKLGSYQAWTSRNFNGLIDEVCIWNRALSQEEIREKRHLTLNVDTETQLLAYYKFNETGSTVIDYKSNLNGTINGSGTTVTSTAPLGKGFSDRLTINGNGTFSFPNSGLNMTIASGTHPSGEVVVSHILTNPNYIIPGKTTISRGYYIFNNYGTNATFTGLSSISFNNLGTITQYMAANFPPALRKRTDNSDATAWSFIMDNPVVVTSGNSGMIQYTSVNNLLNSSGQLIIDRDQFAPTEPKVTMIANSGTDTKVIGGASAELNLNSSSQTLVLPAVNEVELALTNNPVEGLMAYDTMLKTIVFRGNSQWEQVSGKQVYTNPSSPVATNKGLQISGVRDTSSLLNLATASGFILLPSYSNANLPLIDQPFASMMIYNADIHKIQVFDGVQWVPLLSSLMSVRTETPVPASVPGMAIGTNVKNPNANLHITNQYYRTLSIPQAATNAIYHPTKGGITFDPILKEYFLYDGSNWKKLLKS